MTKLFSIFKPCSVPLKSIITFSRSFSNTMQVTNISGNQIDHIFCITINIDSTGWYKAVPNLLVAIPTTLSLAKKLSFNLHVFRLYWWILILEPFLQRSLSWKILFAGEEISSNFIEKFLNFRWLSYLSLIFVPLLQETYQPRQTNQARWKKASLWHNF